MLETCSEHMFSSDNNHKKYPTDIWAFLKLLILSLILNPVSMLKPSTQNTPHFITVLNLSSRSGLATTCLDKIGHLKKESSIKWITKPTRLNWLCCFCTVQPNSANMLLAVVWHLTACDQWEGGNFILINCCRFTAVKKGYVTWEVTEWKDQSSSLETK